MNDDDSTDEEYTINSKVDNICKVYNLNVNDLKIIIDDVLYNGQNFKDLRYEMHECITFILDNNIKLLDFVSNIVMKQ